MIRNIFMLALIMHSIMLGMHFSSWLNSVPSVADPISNMAVNGLNITLMCIFLWAGSKAAEDEKPVASDISSDEIVWRYGADEQKVEIVWEPRQ